ncbi:MAG TPA: RsmE family RNA methyltransferase [Terriglobia bacterium]|nr:RsmE family RNA methyltransferase [Terriglobia bacterium]
MAAKSVYLPQQTPDGDRFRIIGDEHHHLTVGRAAKGEIVEVFDGKGVVWITEVATVSRKETLLQVVEKRHVERQGPEIILGMSVIKPSAFEMALEKVVEVGVTRLIPVIAQRSNAAPARRSDRWNRIMIEAAKQSKSYHLPVIDEPAKFERVLDVSAATKIVFAERGGGPLKSALAGSPAIYLVGPEGGWTDVELETARLKGFHLVGLGDTILRSETAAIVGAALLRYEL